MADEINQFVNKFRDLNDAGTKAFLWLESQAGEVFVTLQAHLSGYQEDHRHHRHFQADLRHHHPFQGDRHHPPPSRHKKASPSRLRRRLRREQARAELSAVKAASESAAEQVVAPTIPPTLSQPVVVAEYAAETMDVMAQQATAAIESLPRLLPVQQPGQYPPPSALKHPSLSVEQAGHHPHPSQHLLPLQPVGQLFKSFRFQVSSLQSSPPSLTSPPRRTSRVLAPPWRWPKPSDPLVMRKPEKYLKTILNQNIERVVWMSTPLLKRVMSEGGRGGWVGDVSLFVRFIDWGLGLYTEPCIVYDDDSDLSDPRLTDTGPEKSILDELD